MKLLTSSFVAALFGAFVLAGCSAESSDVASSSANETEAACVGVTQARATYDHAVQTAQATIQTDYAAALAQHDADAKQAAADRDAALAALPGGDHSSDAYNQVILAYNDKVGADGAIAHAYDAATKAAQDRFNATVKAALATYNATAC